MADTNTNKIGLTKPEIGGSGDTWGEKLNKDMDILDGAVFSHHFAEDSANHSGLNFAYKSGIVRSGVLLSSINEGTVLLSDNATNFVEVNPISGQVFSNTLDFNTTCIPIYQVTTAAGSISEVNDKRSFLVKAASQNTQWFITYAGEGIDNNTSYLTKGAVYEPITDIECCGIGMLNSDLNTQTLKLRLFELNGTTQVGGALAESNNLTGYGEQSFLYFDLPEAIVLKAGKRYSVSISNITSGATSVKTASASHPSNKITGFKRNTYAYINVANPTDGAVWTVSAGTTFVSGLKIIIK